MTVASLLALTLQIQRPARRQMYRVIIVRHERDEPGTGEQSEAGPDKANGLAN